MGLETALIVGLSAAALASVGTGISVYSNLQQAETSKKVADYNARVKQSEAEALEQERRENLRRERLRNKAIVETKRARFAAAGVKESGSALEILSETAGLLELEALDKSRARKSQIDSLNQQANIFSLSGRQASQASELNALSSGLSGSYSTGRNLLYL